MAQRRETRVLRMVLSLRSRKANPPAAIIARLIVCRSGEVSSLALRANLDLASRSRTAEDFAFAQGDQIAAIAGHQHVGGDVLAPESPFVQGSEVEGQERRSKQT